MQLFSILSVAAFAVAAQAHATIYGAWVNGQFQGDGRDRYIRTPLSNAPIKDLKSGALACNTKNVAVPNFVKVEPGDMFTMEWMHDNRNDDIIATSHKGVIQTYIAPYSSNGQGAVWTKLWTSGFYNGTWATEKLIKAHGQHTIYVPSIKAGKYIVRSEIIALHESDQAYSKNPQRGAQIYPSCLQIEVTRNGLKNLSLPGGTSFPGSYTDSSSGIVFNIYGGGPDPKTYKAPGPAVWSNGVGGYIGQVRAV